MSRMVPLLTEVNVRAWGLDDPRVLTHLRAENQPGHHRRTQAVSQRAHVVGWPVESATANAARGAQIRALRRLERMDFTPMGARDRYRARSALPGEGFGRKPRTDDVYETTDALVSIFDE